MPTWALHVDTDLDEVNRNWAALDAAGMLAAAEVDGRAIVYFADRVDLTGVDGHWERLADHDWHARWRAQLTPVRAGRRTIVPPWLAAGGGDELVIDPGQAFGTGHHETTVRCLRALDEEPLDGRTLLDVGTGSGVLAIAAALAGATVTAIDIDPLATAAARDNATRNGVAVDVRTDGIDRCGAARFDVVVANLDSATLIAHAQALRGAVDDGGVLIASGVSNPRRDEVAAAISTVGFTVDARAGDEWTLLRARRTAS